MKVSWTTPTPSSVAPLHPGTQRLELLREDLTAVPNDKWWGDKPKLDRIVVREMADPAARAAYKNGELDAFNFVGATSYNAVKGQAGTEIRQGQNTNATLFS